MGFGFARVRIKGIRISEGLLYCLCVVVVFYYYVRRSVLFKIHAANIEASKFFVLFLSVTMENYS